MKGLVLAGGTGTRLRPLTSTTTKQLLPVANRPILAYIMDLVKAAGIEETGIIVSAEWGEQVKEVMGDGSRWGMAFTYIVQSAPAGLAHAVKTAQPFLGKSPFLMVLGDNVYKLDIDGMMAKFGRSSDALLLLKGVEDATSCGTAVMDGDGKLLQMQEKSPHPKSNLAIAGIYLFSAAIHDAIAATKPSRRGELEITDAVQKLIEMKGDVRGHLLDGWWLDTGDMADLLKANRAVLQEFMTPSIKGIVDAKSHIVGKVEATKGTIIENSSIQGAASIAGDCRIINSRIGPFTCVGAGTEVENSSIEDSIILPACRIRGVHLKNSLIGRKVEINGAARSRAMSLRLGDEGWLQL